MNSPLRIASLLSSATEMLCLLGLAERIVAVSHECDYPPAIADRPRATYSNVDSAAGSGQIDEQVKAISTAGGALYEIDRDLLKRLQPDLIVTQAQCDVCAVRYEEVIDFVAAEPALSATQVVALNPQSLGDVFADIRKVSEAAGASEAADRVVNQLQRRVDAIRKRTKKLSREERPRVAMIEWIEPLMLAANWMPELIEMAGGFCPLTTAGEHSTYASWDDVLNFDPQVLVISPCGFDLPRTLEEAAVIKGWPNVDRLSAHRNGRVYAVDGNAYFNRSGPRLVDSLEILAHLFHPEWFDAPGWCGEAKRPWREIQLLASD